MAAPMENRENDDGENSGDVFVVISNIPPSYHSCDVRNFFIQVVEAGGFTMFHYKHRPMAKLSKPKDSTCCSPSSSSTSTKKTTATAKSTNASGSDSAALTVKDPPGTNTSATPSSDLPGNNSSISDFEKSGNDAVVVGSDKCCAIVRVKYQFLNRLLRAYNRYHWVDTEGEALKDVCLIHALYVITDGVDTTAAGLAPAYVLEQGTVPSTHRGLCMPLADVLAFKELKAPDIMPQGNIGTPTEHFLDLINSCRLPPVIVKRLGLKFKKIEGTRMYSCVPYSYNTKHQTGIPAPHMTGPAISASGRRLLNHGQFKVHQKQKIAASYEKSPPREPVASEDDEEEWERHEAFNDDPANYERNKERLFEEEIELKWEKGGSGLVFYTDAQYWKQFEGDFDEQTADDWDVDVSGYYEKGAGDKDSRDYLSMRAEKRLRDGSATHEEMTAFDPLHIGKFEKHTKGVGRKVLEKQGWKEGEGVGKSVIGRSQAIDSEGQHPRDKRGIGYLGEKVNRYVITRKRPLDQPIISTIYDKPEETDEPDELLERKNPHNIKFRVKH